MYVFFLEILNTDFAPKNYLFEYPDNLNSRSNCFSLEKHLNRIFTVRLLHRRTMTTMKYLEYCKITLDNFNAVSFLLSRRIMITNDTSITNSRTFHRASKQMHRYRFYFRRNSVPFFSF